MAQGSSAVQRLAQQSEVDTERLSRARSVSLGGMPAEEVEHRHRTVTVIAPCVLKDVWVIDFRVRGAVSVVLATWSSIPVDSNYGIEILIGA
jgi:hypothetical protein